MKRLALLLLWPPLAAATPLPVRIEPASPTLGVPMALTVELPDAAVRLSGLPSLAPFELLAPPRQEGRQLRLLLLPMRPGAQTIPALPLERNGEHLATAPLPVSVAEGVPADAKPAPLKGLPNAVRPLSAWWLAPLLLPLALLAHLLWRRRSPQGPPPLESLAGDALLDELHRRLNVAECAHDERLRELRLRLEQLRFAPGPPAEAQVRQLLADYLARAEGA